MRTDDGSLSLPGRRIVQGGVTRIRRTFAAAPLAAQDHHVRRPGLAAPVRAGDPAPGSAAGRAGLRAVRGLRRAPQCPGVAGRGGLGRGPGRRAVRRLPALAGPAPAAAVRGRGRRPRGHARPVVRAVPDRGLDARLVAARRHDHMAAGREPAGDRARGRLADRVRGAGLAAGQVVAGGPGVRPPAGPWRRPGGPLRLAPGPGAARRRAGDGHADRAAPADPDSRAAAARRPGGRRPRGNGRTAAAEAVRAQHAADGTPGPARPMPTTAPPPGRRRSRWTRPWPSWTT